MDFPHGAAVLQTSRLIPGGSRPPDPLLGGCRHPDLLYMWRMEFLGLASQNKKGAFGGRQSPNPGGLWGGNPQDLAPILFQTP